MNAQRKGGQLERQLGHRFWKQVCRTRNSREGNGSTGQRANRLRALGVTMMHGRAVSRRMHAAQNRAGQGLGCGLWG